MSFWKRLFGNRKRATARLSVLAESQFSDNGIKEIRSLLDSGADVNTRSKQGDTPLHSASFYGQSEVIEMLLAANADINVATTRDGSTPLLMASQNGHTEVVKLLLKANADVNAAETDDYTPLIMASRDGHTKIVKLLLDANADVNAVTTDECVTPVYVASQNGHVEVVKLLLAANADINAVCPRTRLTPVGSAKVNRHLEITKLLQATRDGMLNEESTQLDNNDAKFSPESNKQKTMSELNSQLLAAARGHSGEMTKAVTQLLASGAEVECLNDDQETPLMMAAWAGNPDSIEVLLSAGADVKVANWEGKTPLMAAAMSNNQDAVKLLLEAGSEKAARCHSGYSAGYYARVLGKHEIARLLA